MFVQLRLSKLSHRSQDGLDPLNVALGMLMRAHRYAVSTGANRWQFAIELEEFQRAGVGRNELRWLLLNEIALHAQEVGDSRSPIRRFAALPRHVVSAGASFILSDSGLAELEELENAQARNVNTCSNIADELGTARLRSSIASDLRRLPFWDQMRRELCLNGVVVKRFRSLATNQVMILNAFQEEDWPERIDDPLPPAANLDPRRRLGDAIKFLNRNQLHAALRFRGDGTGKGVLWELAE